MMKFIVLPLLVISQLNLQNEVWKHAPTVIYNVTYKADISPPSNPSKDVYVQSMFFSNQLKCQPLSPKILNCYLEPPRIRVRLSNDREFYPDAFKWTSGLELEIRFNKLGIKELVVPASTAPIGLDMVRAIVNQLHVGLDLTENNKSEGTFQKWENFTTGDCLTKYQVQMIDPKSNEEIHKAWNPDVRTLITKTRDVNNCRYLAPYFFTSRIGFLEHPKMNITLKSSKSHVIVDRSTFVSTTKTHVELENNDANDSEIIKLYEDMTVAFDAVVPSTTDKIHEIDMPATAGIISGRWIHEENDN